LTDTRITVKSFINSFVEPCSTTGPCWWEND